MRRLWSCALITAGVIVVAAVIWTLWSYQTVPVDPPTTASSSPSSLPVAVTTADAVPSTPAPSSSTSPTSSPASPTTVQPSPVCRPTTPTGSPKHIKIFHGGKLIIGTDLVASYMDATGELAPADPYKGGWFANAGWPMPGVPSANHSIVIGHSGHSYRPNVFWNLKDARSGDVVHITYTSGDVVTLVGTIDPVLLGKDDVTRQAETTYRWVWRTTPGEKTTVSFFTCDPDSYSNVVWQATVGCG